ncbi:MAG: hypothetical protein K8H88_18290 [Sandaracinaceae bacterium]|nr:hypothetical protein [Sandaracinaceae bacterium]
MSELPPCGLYVTRAPIGSIPAGRLVYFHNHGDPGPGLYLPASWRGNRARFDPKGQLLGDLRNADHLAPLPREGFYRVVEPFHCCEKRCREFRAGDLVQLGYDASARSILFVPEIVDGELRVPERGSRVDPERMRVEPLNVPIRGDVHESDDRGEPGDVVLH